MAGATPVPRRWLVVGGTGFLGSHVLSVVRALAGIEHVVATGRTPPAGDGDWAVLDLARGDARSIDALLRHVRPDVVVNASGAAVGAPAELAAANVTAVRALLDAIGRWSPRRAAGPIRLVHLGSAAEYGVASTTGRPIGEDSPPHPVSEYGALKLEATRQVLAAASATVDPVVLRIFNPMGAGMPPESLPGIAARRLAAAVHDGRPEVMLGSLDASRDFVDARDVAAAVVAAGSAPDHSGVVINVGSGTATPVRDVVKMLARAAGFNGRIVESGSGSARSGGVDWQAADIQRARALLRWEPRHGLEDAVEQLWASVAGPGQSAASRR